MTYSCFALANSVISITAGSSELITLKELQRLLFCLQVKYLTLKNAPLMDDTFVQWPGGPVVPSLHHKLQAWGAHPLTTKIPVASTDPSVRQYPVINPKDFDTLAFIYTELALLLKIPRKDLILSAYTAAAGAKVPEGQPFQTEDLLRAAPLLATALAACTPSPPI